MALSPAELASAIVPGPTGAADWLVVTPTVLCILGAALALMLRRVTPLQPAFGIGTLALVMVGNAGLLARVVAHGPVVMTMGRWLPPFGISFTVDALGATFGLVAAIAALMAAVYAMRDIEDAGRRVGFYPLLLLLMAGVNGAFFTGDIFNLYVWFEVFLISSFGLIALGGEPRQLDGTVKYAFLSLIGTTLFLVAVGYLYAVTGTLNMADLTRILRESGDGQSLGPLVSLAALFLFAFSMKAAAFPLHYWLPASYHTPRIVVGALFAGLLTKVGVYALLRVLVMLMPAERAVLAEVLAWTAGLTMLFGALGALAQAELRRMAGYLVLSGIGMMLVGVALATEAAVAASILYAVHSVVVMTALYLVIGVIERIGGARDLVRLAGLWGTSPLVSALFFIVCLAVAGLPPFSGFWPKVMLVRAALEAHSPWLAAGVLISGVVTLIAVGRAFALVVWRVEAGGPARGHDGAPLATLGPRERAALLGPVVALVAIVVALGVLPESAVAVSEIGAAGLIDPATYLHAVLGGTTP